MRSRISLSLFLLAVIPGCTQIRQIDPRLLPQDAAVQNAYTSLLPIDEYARNYLSKWRYPIAKNTVADRFSIALTTFEAAHKQAPANTELTVLTGLTAHLAYNLDIESAYKPAEEALIAAHLAAPADPRPQWFLAMHQCESNNPVAGMDTLLAVESAHSDLPLAFWRDYALCAEVSDMPAHAARAYDRAKTLGNADPTDDKLAEIARNGLKPGSPLTTYTHEHAWTTGTATEAKTVRFTSPLCGFSFVTSSESQIVLPDIKDGVCAVTISPPGYTHEIKWHTPTLLVLTRPAKQGESLLNFADSFLRQPSRKPYATTGIPCPVAQCLEYELRDPNTYASAGGAHFFVVVYSVPPPTYPGLALESPQPLPRGKPGEMQYYRREDQPHRFPGTLYVFATVDASEAIIEHSRTDFESLLHSIVMDDK